MSYRQLTALFIINMTTFIVGNSLMALLPLYINQNLGAESVVVGIAISIAFAILVVSTSVTAKLSRYFKNRRDLLTLSAIVSIPSVWYMGQTDSVIIFTILMAVVWFCAGIQITSVQILAALQTDPEKRGRVFGILQTSGPLAMLIGGFLAGWIVDLWGFETLYLVCAGLFTTLTVITRTVSNPKVVQTEATSTKSTERVNSLILLLLIGASILAHTSSFIINMARPLAMNALNFDASAITGAVGVAGIITLALPFIVGMLSDRLGRKPVFIGIYMLTALGIVYFQFASSLMDFWIAQALVTVLTSSMVVGTAYVTDIVPQAQIDSSVSHFSTTPWVGAVIGSIGAGASIQQLGIDMTFMLATALVVMSIGMLFMIRSDSKAKRHTILTPVVR